MIKTVIKLTLLFIFLILNVFGSIEENFSGGGVSIEGKGNFDFRQYDINDDWDKSLYLNMALGIGYFPKDRLELFINPVLTSEFRYYKNDDIWKWGSNTLIDIGIKYAFLLNKEESKGFVLIPGIAVGNHIDGYLYGYEYSISFCPFIRLDYFVSSRFAFFTSLEPRYIIRTIEPHGINVFLYFGAEFYFPRSMRILFKNKML